MLKWKLAVTGAALLSMMGLAGCASTPAAGSGPGNASGYSSNAQSGVKLGASQRTASASSSASSSANFTGNAAKTVVSASKSTSSSSLVPVVVAKEVDGDTIHVTMPNGTDETIRMLLIDTPEDVKPNTPVEPFSLAAAAFAKQELPVGRHIYLEEGKPGYTRDKYGRLLAFVYITKTDMYNEDVVRRGLARVGYIYPPNTQHLSDLEADQSYAKSHDLGIWTIPGYVTSSGYNMNAVPAGYSGNGYSAGGTTTSGGASYGTTGTKTSSASTGGASAVSTSTSGASTGSTSTGGLTVVSSNLSVSRGDYASVTVHASAGASGSIEVDYKSGPSHASGLGSKTADANGNITWRFEVGTSTTKGNWPVLITVGSKSLRLTLTVK